MDVLHTQWLHTAHSRPQFPSDLYGIPPQVRYEETAMGHEGHDDPEAAGWPRVARDLEMIMPMTLHLVYTAVPRTDEADDTYERHPSASRSTTRTSWARGSGGCRATTGRWGRGASHGDQPPRPELRVHAAVPG